MSRPKRLTRPAVDRGEIAGLFEQSTQASDVFTTTIGNLPAKEDVTVTITYVGELKQDSEIDGVRLTIPTAIAPRYGSYAGPQSTAVATKGMAITVDVSLPDGSVIKKVQSPSHNITVSIGTLSNSQHLPPSFSKASATLTQDTTELATDFVLQLVAEDVETPRALLESHPTIQGHRALMATLVPRFALRPEKPEIIFCVDRSGSMGGCIPTLKSAMKVFLKSLPLGVKFNICSFGSHHDFPVSQICFVLTG